MKKQNIVRNFFMTFMLAGAMIVSGLATTTFASGYLIAGGRTDSTSSTSTTASSIDRSGYIIAGGRTDSTSTITSNTGLVGSGGKTDTSNESESIIDNGILDKIINLFF